MKTLLGAILLLAALAAGAAEINGGTYKRYYGSGVNNGDLLFTATNTSEWDSCTLTSTTGAVTLEVSLDGTNWSPAIAFEDYHSTDPTSEHVTVSVATKIYGIHGKFLAMRLRQSGATAAAGVMDCWSEGQSRTTPPGGV